ncbi:conserved hypothetical protein [Enterobacterales bacterium 8AC]|nr:conserved hypothetical protein [Enterobacterales bacterium 8AC]
MNEIRYPRAPELSIACWFNTVEPVTLESLRGKVIVMESFQMLCPGCVAHGLPQAARIYATFPQDEIAVIGLHTVFEHHKVMTPLALQSFLAEYRIPFPVGVDMPSLESNIPQTMQTYSMRGTPTLTLIDRQGYLRQQYFGEVSDLIVGAEIGALLNESLPVHEKNAIAGCSDKQCSI